MQRRERWNFYEVVEVFGVFGESVFGGGGGGHCPGPLCCSRCHKSNKTNPVEYSGGGVHLFLLYSSFGDRRSDPFSIYYHHCSNTPFTSFVSSINSHNWCCGVVVITSVLHTEGLQFDPGQHHHFFSFFLLFAHRINWKTKPGTTSRSRSKERRDGDAGCGDDDRPSFNQPSEGASCHARLAPRPLLPGSPSPSNDYFFNSITLIFD